METVDLSGGLASIMNHRLRVSESRGVPEPALTHHAFRTLLSVSLLVLHYSLPYLFWLS